MYDWLYDIISNISSKIFVTVVSTLLVSATFAFLAWLGLRGRFRPQYRLAINHLRQGEALQSKGQHKAARDEITKTINLLSDEIRSSIMTEAYLRAGDISAELEDYDDAIKHYILCREMITRKKDIVGEDAILLKLGTVYMRLEKYEEAFRYFDEARIIQERVIDQPLLAETYSRLGEIEGLRGHMEIAIDQYLRALGLHEKLGDQRSQAAARVSLGDLYKNREDFDQALNHYGEAARLYKNVGDGPVARMLEEQMDSVQKEIWIQVSS